jgi:hypothetical protein
MKQQLQIILGLLFIFFATSLHAQIGWAFFGGSSTSSFRGDTMSNSTGGTGFEVGAITFAKYSDRVEWNTSMSYVSAKRSVTAYKGETVYGSTTYTPQQVNFNANQLNLSYSLLYYAIPDKLAIHAGYDLGLAAFSNVTNFMSYDYDLVYLLTKDPNPGAYDPYARKTVKDAEVTSFCHGPTFGLSYTHNDRYFVYAKYSMFLNNYFGNETTSFADEAKLNLLRMGLGIKLIPSAKNKRF